MEYIHTVLAQVPANRAGDVSRAGGLLTALDEHRDFLEQQPGYQDMRVTRSINREGQIQLVIETRWEDEDSLVRYETNEPNLASIVNQYDDILVSGSVQVLDMEALRSEPRALTAREIRDRLALPFILPIGVLAFALLVIYGLSRVYLEVPADVATPLAAGIAGGIFVVGWFLATHPQVTGAQVATIIVAAGALLIGGSLFAVIHDDGGDEASAGTPEADATGTPGAASASGQLWSFTAVVVGGGEGATTAAIESYAWDFDDGTTATTSGGTTAHVYETQATEQRRTVTVTVRTQDGRSATGRTEILVGKFPI